MNRSEPKSRQWRKGTLLKTWKDSGSLYAADYDEVETRLLMDLVGISPRFPKRLYSIQEPEPSRSRPDLPLSEDQKHQNASNQRLRYQRRKHLTVKD